MLLRCIHAEYGAVVAIATLLTFSERLAPSLHTRAAFHALLAVLGVLILSGAAETDAALVLTFSMLVARASAPSEKNVSGTSKGPRDADRAAQV